MRQDSRWIRSAVLAVAVVLSTLAFAQEMPLNAEGLLQALPHAHGLLRTTPDVINVVVTEMKDVPSAMGLTRERVEQHVTRRLEFYGFRVVDGWVDDGATVYISVQQLRSVACISIDVGRVVVLLVHDEALPTFAITSRRSILAPLDSPLGPADGDYIISRLSEMLDDFFAAYLLANPRPW